MKTRILNLALAAVLFVMSVSGCASISVPTSLKGGKLLKGESDSIELKFGVARMLERNGKLAEARKSYLEILGTQSHSPTLHRLGVTAIRQNRLDEGLKHLAEAVAAGDVTTELLGDYGYAQFLAGEMSAAEQTLRKAVSLDPSKKRNVNNLAIVIGKQDRFTESFRLFRQAGSEAEALANLAFLQSQSEDLSKARENYSKALDLDPQLKVAAVGLLEVDKHISKNAPLKQAPELEIEDTRPERQASWNQLAESASDSTPEPKQTVDRIPATQLLPLMDHHEDIDDVNQQISAIEEKIRVRQENLEKLQESTRLQESARLAAIAEREAISKREELAARDELARLQEVNRKLELAERDALAARLKLVEREDVAKREELARLKEANRRLELAEREELAMQLKLAKREDIAKRLELDQWQGSAKKDSAKRDDSADLDPMSSIAKLIEENKRIKKRTSQPAQ